MLNQFYDQQARKVGTHCKNVIGQLETQLASLEQYISGIQEECRAEECPGLRSPLEREQSRAERHHYALTMVILELRNLKKQYRARECMWA